MDYFANMKKKKGFSGERIIDIKSVLNEQDLGSLIFSKIGFFPKARHQYNDGMEKEQYILLYCVEGFGEIIIRNKKYILNVGDFFIVPKSINYIYCASKENPWSFYWFYFKDNSDWVAKTLDFFYKHNGDYKGSLAYNEERVCLFNAIFDKLNKGYSADNLKMLEMCLLNFLSSLVFSTNSHKKNQYSKANRIEEAIEFMKRKVDGNLSLPELAKILSLSNSQFSHLFREKTGVSPLEYFNQLKIKKACKYLENTGLQIKQIAYKIGIQDAAYFSRLFTKTIGISPVKYRQEILKK